MRGVHVDSGLFTCISQKGWCCKQMENIRRRLNNSGTESLTDAELISLITRKKIHDSFRIAESYAREESFKSDLGRCRSVEEIRQKFGLTKTQATSVLASVELGRRIALLPTQKPYRVTSPSDAASYFMSSMRYENHERFMVMLLSTKNHVIRAQQIAEGSLSSAVVHPREVFAPAIIYHAATIIVVHNHPSGDPQPSFEDKQLTKALKNAGDICGIPVQDHIIIGDGYYYSFKEHGDL